MIIHHYINFFLVKSFCNIQIDVIYWVLAFIPQYKWMKNVKNLHCAICGICIGRSYPLLWAQMHSHLRLQKSLILRRKFFTYPNCIVRIPFCAFVPCAANAQCTLRRGKRRNVFLKTIDICHEVKSAIRERWRCIRKWHKTRMHWS